MIQEPTLTVVAGMVNTQYRKGTEKCPTLDKTPSVAAPQPNSVNGPLKKPRIASAANNIHTTYSLVGMIPPITSLKNGEAYVAHVLNMGSVSRKPIKGAVSTTPS